MWFRNGTRKPGPRLVHAGALRSVTSAPAGLLLFLGVVCCAAPSPMGAWDVERFRQKAQSWQGERLLAHLDVSGDGSIDQQDVSLLQNIAGHARAETVRRKLPLAIHEQLYKGVPKGEPSAFAQLRTERGRLELTQISDERIVELAIEARWMAQQARLAVLAVATPKDQPFGGLFRHMLQGYHQEAMAPAAVCAALERLDTSVWTQASVPATAVFDLDRTVWHGNVSDAFLARLAEMGIPRSTAVDGYLRSMLQRVPGIPSEQVMANSVQENTHLAVRYATDPSLPPEKRISAKDAFYLTVALLEDVPLEEAQSVAKAVFETDGAAFPAWNKQIYSDSDGCGMRRILKLLEDRGVVVYALSATLDLLAREGARVLGIPPERALGSQLEVLNGRYTGKVRANTYSIKGPIVRQWLEAPPLFVFGDSPTSDLPMLMEAGGAAFMVNPRVRFQELDKELAGSRFVGLSFDGTERELAAGGCATTASKGC